MPQIPKTPRRSVACVVVLVAFLFVCPASVAAIPIAEYQQNLKQAISALEELMEVDQSWDETDFSNRLLATIELVRVTLPAHQTVEADGEVCNIDNLSLHQSLEDLKKLPSSEQFEELEKITEQLQ